MQTTLRSERDKVLFFKYVFPLFLLSISILSVVGNHPSFAALAWRTLLYLPVLFASLFLLASAEVEANSNGFSYRRLVRWRQIPFSQVRVAKRSWVPGLSICVTDHFVPPFGRLYFVSDRSVGSRGEGQFIDYINSHGVSPKHESRHVGMSSQRGQRRSMVICIGMGVLGFIYTTILSGWTPDVFKIPDLEGLPKWTTIAAALISKFSNWPWSLFTIGVLVAAIVGTRFKERAWVLALIVGLLLGHLLMKPFQ